MRTNKQKQRFNDFIEIIECQPDLEKEITKAYIQQKQYLLLTQFEEVADIKKGEGISSFFQSDDYNGIFNEYYSNYYTSFMLLMYYEYFEDYAMCNIMKEIIQMNHKIMVDTIKTIVGSDEITDTLTIIDISQDEIKNLIQQNYGTNY